MKISHLTLFVRFTFVALTFAQPQARAQERIDDEYVTYDRIVEDLQSQSKRVTRETNRLQNRYSSLNYDPFANIWIHAGVGLAQATANFDLPNGSPLQLSARGIQAAIGIDVLGPSLTAEGTVRNFGESEDASAKIQLKEFDLKILAKHRIGRFNIKGGGGLSARYVNVKTLTDFFEVTTPASVLQFGGDFYLTSSISIGLDLSARSAMIGETFDRTSYDGTLRMDTHF
jgi:hypothetical protein